MTARQVLGVLLFVGATLLSLGRPAAQAPSAEPRRVLEFSFRPTARAQIAVWLERPDGTFVDTIALTQAVSYRGIGNRPGATLMNSGFRWPYGRREGALPQWAHRRASAPGAVSFPRVVFQDRSSEGFASRTSADASPDNYYCLSFDVATTGRDALDAVTCASVFNSDKGRYATEADVSRGYAEPWQRSAAEGGGGEMRALSLKSLYPPRRDALPCVGALCEDHPDLARFAADARAVMPNIDAVTMATPAGERPVSIAFDVPPAWPSGDYVAYLEINVEGDYNGRFNATSYPTPSTPTNTWDSWAQSYGYPYRGQPAVVYRVPIRVGETGDWDVADPEGYAALHGEVDTLFPMAANTISDDPLGAPGSGADRLRVSPAGARFSVRGFVTNPCELPDAPAACGRECAIDAECGSGLVCSAEMRCVGLCEAPASMPPLASLAAQRHPDVKNAHQWALLSFVLPEMERPLREVEVRVSTRPIFDEAGFIAAEPAFAASLDSVALEVPNDGAPGDLVEVAFGGLQPETTYNVGVRVRDQCNEKGPIRVATLTTSKIHFTSVSPCFVASAAYGTPFAKDIDTLRAFRDQHLMTHAPGRAFVRAYYALGPSLAEIIRDRPVLRALTRVALRPVVAICGWLVDKP